MEMRSIFNILLLSLSLGTVLITLVSYLIYKLRQMTIRQEEKDYVHLDGVFFQKYAPHLMKKDNDLNVNDDNTARTTSSILKEAGAIFSIVVLIIFTTLILEQYVSDRKVMSKRENLAKSYRELTARGLMKTYDFNPNRANPSSKEYIASTEYKQLALLVKKLSSIKIAFISSPINIKYNKIKHTAAMRAWLSFFKRHKIKYKKIKSFNYIDRFDLVILPQHISLSDDQRQKILNSTTPILSTGPIGVLNGVGNMTPLNMLEKLYELSFHKNQEQKILLPSKFSSMRPPYWNIPPGLVLDWFPTDNRYIAVSSNMSSSIYESRYTGRKVYNPDLSHNIARSSFITKSNRRLAWLAFDPILIKSKDKRKALHYYSDLTLINTLLWSVQKPLAIVDFWKNAKTSAFLMSIDVEDEFENIKHLLKIINKHQLPSTLFLVSDLFIQMKNIVLDNTVGKVEFASHSDDHGIFTDGTPGQLHKRLENSRLDIEEITELKVNGVRPPLEIYDNNSLNSIVQNNFTYLFGNQRYYRYYPLMIGNGDLIYFPRVVYDDYTILKTRSIAGDDDILSALINDFKRVRGFGGGYFFNVHTQGFGQKVYLDSVDKFLSEAMKLDPWFTTFSELSTWYKERKKLRVKILKDKAGKYLIEVINNNDVDVDGVSLSIDIAHNNTQRGISKDSIRHRTEINKDIPVLKYVDGKVILPVQKKNSTFRFYIQK